MIDPDVLTMSSWDVERLASGPARLDVVADRVPGWRGRLDRVAGTVAAGRAWTGPSSDAAGAVLAELTSSAAVLSGALEESLVMLRRAVAEATEARDAAAQAIAAEPPITSSRRDLGSALAPGPDLEGDRFSTVLLPRIEALSSRAREHADAAAAAAGAARDGLPQRAVPPMSWCGWGAEFPGRELVEVPPVPHAAGVGAVQAVASWWAVMTPAQRYAAIARQPTVVGALDGVPAWARDQANRLVLARSLATGGGRPPVTALAVTREIAARERRGEVVQLLQFDLRDDLVALSLGDLDAAEAVGVLVPGTGNEPGDDLDALAADAHAVSAAAQAAAPGASIATVAWMGYRTPAHLPAAVSPHHARPGGRALAATLEGVSTARSVAGRPGAHVTVVGHSYGTVVVDRAAEEDGRLAADGIVLLGSPGMTGPASDLEVGTVHEASAPLDPVPVSGAHGNQMTWQDRFGAEELPTEWGMRHSDYYDADRPTLAAIGEAVVDGVR